MTSPKFRSLKSGLISSAALFVLALPAYAQPSLDNTKDLGEVLNQFATDANVEILFSPDLVNKQVASVAELSGEPRENLLTILTGTGLSFEEPSPDVFIITEASATLLPTTSSKPLESETVKTNFQKTAQVQTEATSATQSTPSALPNRFDLEAAPGVITGQVVDQFSNQALAGAIVMLEGSGRTTSTDSRGFYRFSAAPVGEYGISVNYLGAEFQSRRVAIVSGQAVTQNFSLGNQLDELVVYGNRSSLQQALNQQRAADNSATVVSSDLLGSFPAETISEALRRVSGVSFTRDAATGEGDRISVRGFGADAINVQLNGIDLQGTGIDRSIDLSGFLTDNIKQVTIQKSLLPSQEATGSGGLVEIETRSGLDYGKKYFNLGIEREQSFAGGFGDEFEISGTGAYQLTDDFGVSATVQYRETDGQNYDVNPLFTEEQVLPVGFTSSGLLPESFNFPFDPEFVEPLYTNTNFFSRQRDESNLTMSLNFAYDWEDHTRLRLDLQQINSDAEFSESRATVSFLASSTDMPIPELGDEIRRRSYIRSFRPTLGINDSVDDLKSSTISFRGETDINDWEFDYTVGYSEIQRDRLRNSISFLSNQNTDIAGLVNPSTAIFNTDDDTNATQRLVGGAFAFAPNGTPFPSLSQAGLDYLFDPATHYVTSATVADARDRTETLTFELDGRKYFNNSPLEYIELGGKYEDRERRNSDDLLSTTNLTSSRTYIRISPLNTFINDLNPNGFGLGDLSNIGLSQAQIPFVTSGSSQAFLDAIDGFLVDDPNTPENEARFRLTDRTGADPIVDSGAKAPAGLKEELFAGWVQAKAVFGDFDVVGGVRYQREERTGSAIITPSVRSADNVAVSRDAFIEAGLIDFLDTSNTQETWTPSVIANYRPTDEFVVRGAYFRSTVHPSIDKIIRPSQIIVNFRDTAFAGPSARIREPNPDLQPSKIDNFDLDFSYFFKDNPGLIRLGLFWKRTSNNFANTLVADEATSSELRERILDELAPLLVIDPTLLDFPDNTEFFLQRPRNGEGGDIYGFEGEIIRQLDFLPESWPQFLENFSVLGNITYTTSDFVELETARNDDGELFTLELDRLALNQNRWSGNASLRYEDGPFSGSVIYTYQSASPTGYDEFNLNNITPEFDTLDLRASYTLEAEGNRPRMIFYVEGDDLLRSADEADIRSGIGSQFGDGNVDFFFPTQYQFNGGRRFTVGARMTF